MPRVVTPLKVAIVASGLTNQEVADLIGRHSDEVSKWANDKRTVTRSTKIALANALNSTVEELFPPKSEQPNESEVAA